MEENIEFTNEELENLLEILNKEDLDELLEELKN